jgi:uncharacterized protein YceK
MKILIIALFVLTLSGCGVVERFFAGVTGGGTATCFRGVTYVQFTSGASVAYNTNGSVMLCD